MPCYRPLTGVVKGREFLSVACGQCIGCRLERSREWAVRCVHEASLYEANAFVTLTYAPEHLPAGGSLVRDEFPKFIRRLRKPFPRGSIRYFACGEYGDENRRPHYHAILFGFSPADKEFFFASPSGEDVYRSAYLDSVWGLGLTSLGSVTFESAAYVARYVVKKVTGAAASGHYESFDSTTGEIFARLPERNWMSLRPGIGQRWLQKYFNDVYPSDEVISRGVSCGVPRYYDKLAAVGAPDLVERLKLERVRESYKRLGEQAPSRRGAREIVKLAQVGYLKREV